MPNGVESIYFRIYRAKMAITKVMMVYIYKASFVLFTLIIKGKKTHYNPQSKTTLLQVGNPM